MSQEHSIGMKICLYYLDLEILYMGDLLFSECLEVKSEVRNIHINMYDMCSCGDTDIPNWWGRQPKILQSLKGWKIDTDNPKGIL